MIDLGSHCTTEAIDNWVKENPPHVYSPKPGLNKMVTAFVSQSLPPPTLDALPSHTFKIADFSAGKSYEFRKPLL